MNENPHLTRIGNNLNEVYRLVEIHKDIAGTSPGRKYKVEILNKSAIVLIVASWEGFIEDLARTCFYIIIKNCKDSRLLPNKIKAEISKDLKEDKNLLKLWDLADNGWINVLEEHGYSFIKKKIDYFHVPRPQNIDALYEHIIGIKKLSSNWKWKGASSRYINKQLNDLINLRGDIAHSNYSLKSVSKSDVTSNAKFIIRLAGITHNIILKFLKSQYKIDIELLKEVIPAKEFVLKWK